MKAAIPLITGEDDSVHIANDFRSADRIRIFDSIDRSFIDYSTADFQLSASLTDILNEMNVFAVIARAVMPLALRAFEEAGICCYLPQSNDIQHNLDLFSENKLSAARTSVTRSSCSSEECASCAAACKGGSDADR